MVNSLPTMDAKQMYTITMPNGRSISRFTTK